MKYEIWLDSSDAHFARGIIHEDGKALPMKVWVNPSTYGKDSVQITDAERYTYPEFLVSWLTGPDMIEIYHWAEEVDTIVLHNTEAPIRIDGFRTLQPGESMEIHRNEDDVHGSHLRQGEPQDRSQVREAKLADYMEEGKDQ